MPVFKVNKNGEWQDIASAYSHSHTISDITDLPDSLAEDIDALKKKVGAESVAYQVSTAIEAAVGYKHPESHPADMITGLSAVATSGSYNDLSDLPKSGDFLPETTTDDNGKVLGVVDGTWQKIDVKASGGGNTTTVPVDKKISYDFATQGMPTVIFDSPEMGVRAYKISDATPSIEELQGAVISTTYYPDNDNYLYEGVIEEDAFVISTPGLLMTGSLEAELGAYTFGIARVTGDVFVPDLGVTVNIPETGFYLVYDIDRTPPGWQFELTYTTTEEVFVKYAADYAENDPDSSTYIKNRPFYEEENVIYESAELTDTWNENDGRWMGEMAAIDDSSADLVVGETYNYIWDGEEYESECFLYQGLPVIGNTIFSTGEFDGQPVLIVRDANNLSGMGKGWFFALMNFSSDPTQGQHSCRIVKPILKKIDRKFIPTPPEFDLSAMGLPALHMDGSVVQIQCDTSELCSALDKNVVKVSFKMSMGEVETTINSIINAIELDGTYNCGFMAFFVDTPYFVTFMIEPNIIQGRVVPLALQS